ncbi:methyltransferase domain-containing protein [Marinomonas agarivorans]|nr:methyltransferase domain-containing protein [Marinomonas agarivorans]
MMGKKARQYFQQWYESDLGREILEQETTVLRNILDQEVGYYLLTQSPLANLTFPDTLLKNHIVLAPELELGAPKKTIVANANELPINSEAIDVHILHHTLELSGTPHDDLREAARTLLPSGKLIIVSFNPWSLWRAAQWFCSKKQAPWDATFIAQQRLEDWLKVAGLTLQSTDYMHYAPPFSRLYKSNNIRKLDRLLTRTQLPFGGIYIVTATKHTHSLISQKLKWRRSPVRVASLTKPVTKEIQK